MNNCPCDSGVPYTECCQPVISGASPAETAEALMRARYSAYAMKEMDFIFESTHPDHRQNYDQEGTRTWAENSQWLGLEIISTTRGGKDDICGQVEFIARFSEKGGAPREHHENSRFIREEGVWYFTDGEMARQRPLISNKVGRNDPCSCGSGIKYKKCCGR